MRRYLPLVCVLFLMLASCNSSTNPFISDPKVTFQNKSTSNSTFNVVWDGTNIGTISPGGSKTITSTAGTHVLQFKFASNNAAACTPATTTLVNNRNYTYSCTG